MRLSNNIHNICELEGAQLVQEWKEEQKIPIKKSKPAPSKPSAEEPKKDEKPSAEDDAPKTDEKMPPADGATADADKK